MKTSTAGAVAGLVAGAVVSGVMLVGRDAGLLRKTLAEDAQDWLDDRFDARRRLGEDGTVLAEQTGHYLASLGFGATYGKIRPVFGFLPGIVSGALFGAGLYAFGVAGVLPELGVTRGERNEDPGVPTERFGIHLLYGAVLGIVTDGLSDRPRSVRTVADGGRSEASSRSPSPNHCV